MTANLRNRIAEALRRHEPPTHIDPEGLPDDEFECCTNAVMAVIEPDLAERGAALRGLMVAAEKLVLDWPNPGKPEHRQAVNRAIDEVEVLFGDVIRAGLTRS